MLSSLAKKCLQNINDSFTKLEKKDVVILHSIVAKLLWVEKGEGLTLRQLYFSYSSE